MKDKIFKYVTLIFLIMVGKLNLIVGPMYSGKTSEIISRYHRHNVIGKKCVFIKYNGDNRYSLEDKIVSHNFIEKNAIATDLLNKVDEIVQDFDIILVDEIQFYSDACFFCDKWANDGKIVEACGLNGDFERKPFEQVNGLIAKSDNIYHLKAIGKDGNYAPFTTRLSNDKQQKLIGGIGMYEAMSRKDYIEFNKRKLFQYETI